MIREILAAFRLRGPRRFAGARGRRQSTVGCPPTNIPSNPVVICIPPEDPHWRQRRKCDHMQLRVGYELLYDCPQPTPMMLMLNIHHSRASDIVVPDCLMTEPSVPLTFYRDAFGNWCTRLVAPAGPDAAVGDGDRERPGHPRVRRALGSPARGSRSSRRVPAVSARQSILRNRPAVGRRLVAVPAHAGRRACASRRFATTCISTSPSGMRMRDRRERHGKCSRSARASAATTRTWRSRSAGA